MNSSIYLKAVLVLILVDFFWLSTAGIFARAMYERIQGEAVSFRYLAAAVVYLALAYLLLETTSYSQAFLSGMAIYATYDFTNYAVFERYDLKFALADSLWGGVLFVFARYLLKHVF
jgi:uncharacterized membrane protein